MNRPTTRNGERTLIYPGKKDPRWIILAFLSCFVAYALASPGFGRSLPKFALTILTCVGLDALLLLACDGLLLVPLSAIITSLGTLLLCDSPYLWAYPLVAGLAILSKRLIRVEGRHVFNPNNFGIVVAMLFLGGDVTVVSGRWGGSLLGMGLLACSGVFTAFRAGRLDLSAAYLASFLVGTAVRGMITHAPLGALIAPLTGAAFHLFTFYMITDPITTPSNAKTRVLFGVALGAVDNVLRYNQVHNSPFYALFFLTSLLPLLGHLRGAFSRKDVWVLHELPLE